MLAEKEYQTLVGEKKELEEQFISIGLHSIGVSEYLIAKDQSWENISQWFHIANGIKDLNYDGINYDSAYSMCRPVYEYETARQKLYQRLVKEITTFTYLYNGLEAIISTLNIKNCPKFSGKINAATYTLQQKFNDIDLPVKLYSETVKLLERMFQSTLDEEYVLEGELKNKCVSVHGLGLRMLYKVRNMIMHGDFFSQSRLATHLPHLYSQRLSD